MLCISAVVLFVDEILSQFDSPNSLVFGVIKFRWDHPQEGPKTQAVYSSLSI